MNRNALVRYCPPYICAVAVAACALLSAQVQAEQRDVTIQVSVSTAGLDLSRPDAALALYYRLSKAAFEVCSNPLLVDAPSGPASASCYERTLGNAVRSARQPLLSAIYAKKHTQQAATNRDTDVASVPVSH